MSLVPALTDLLLDIAAGEVSPLGREAEALLGWHHATRLAIDLFERDWRLSGDLERVRDQVQSLMHRYNEVLTRYEEPGTTPADADLRTARQHRPHDEPQEREGAG